MSFLRKVVLSVLSIFALLFVSSVIAATSANVLTAVGVDTTKINSDGIGVPLLATSNDKGLSWSVKTITNNIEHGIFNGVSCTDNLSLCISVGFTQITPRNFSPLLAMSTDGANTWIVTAPSSFPPSGDLRAASCIDGSSTCIAVGDDNYITGKAPLTVSIDGGVTWNTKTIDNSALPPVTYSQLSGISCTGKGADARCIAVGSYNNQQYYIVKSADGGNSWTAINTTSLPAQNNAYINKVSCVGSGPTAICTAVGNSTILVSIDGGTTWSAKTSLPSSSSSPQYTSTNCVGSGFKSFCVAAGRTAFGPSSPLLSASADEGNTWANQTINGLPRSGGLFSGVSCTGSGVNTICAAVGGDDSNIAFIAVKTENSNSWYVKHIRGISNDRVSILLGVNCFGNGPATCTAVGEYDNGSNWVPLVIVSTDSGATWAVKTLNGSPQAGSFVSTSGAVASQKVN